MGQRKRADEDTELRVLMESARRCAFCYGFDDDLRRKKGQIAHIDRNPSNSDEGNLAYLCFDHHDEYDSRTSQAKGLQEKELLQYKKQLIDVIRKGEHFKESQAEPSERARAHDSDIFSRSNVLMPETFLMDFLDNTAADHSYWTGDARRLDSFRDFFSEVGNQFLDAEINVNVVQTLNQLDSLLAFMATQFFIFPRDQSNNPERGYRLCMQPDLNVDRSMGTNAEQRAHYRTLTASLHEFIQAVSDAFGVYRSSVKTRLFV